MDISALLGVMVDTFINFWLNLFLDGLFNLLSDLLFGGPASSLL